MEKTIADIIKVNPVFHAGYELGQRNYPAEAIVFSQKELQYLKWKYKSEINSVDRAAELHYSWCRRNKQSINKSWVRQLKNYRKFLSEIQRKVKKALNAGSW